MNNLQYQLLGLIVVVPVIGFLSWFFPRRCKHCRKWVIPGQRYVWSDPFFYNYTHFDLHVECAGQYFSHEKKEEPEVIEGPTNLKPISTFGRFILDESWLAVLLLVVIAVLLWKESLSLAAVSGLIAAMMARLSCALILRFIFKIDHQRVNAPSILG